MGDTLRYAERMQLIAMEPRGDLSSTGYALANPGQEYLVLQPSETAEPFTVTLEAGSYQVEWFSVNGRETQSGRPGDRRERREQQFHGAVRGGWPGGVVPEARRTLRVSCDANRIPRQCYARETRHWIGTEYFIPIPQRGPAQQCVPAEPVSSGGDNPLRRRWSVAISPVKRTSRHRGASLSCATPMARQRTGRSLRTRPGRPLHL